jgi:hypothetical protein
VDIGGHVLTLLEPQNLLPDRALNHVELVFFRTLAPYHPLLVFPVLFRKERHGRGAAAVCRREEVVSQVSLARHEERNPGIARLFRQPPEVRVHRLRLPLGVGKDRRIHFRQ